MAHTKTREQTKQAYVSPKWHGVVGWLAAYGFGVLIGIGFIVSGFSAGTNLDPQLLADMVSFALISGVLGAPVFASMSLLLIWIIRRFQLPRLWSEAAGGALLLGGWPILILWVEHDQVSLEHFRFALLGALCGLVYWLITNWLFRRGEQRWQKQIVEQF
jgi:hypothetical protein